VAGGINMTVGTGDGGTGGAMTLTAGDTSAANAAGGFLGHHRRLEHRFVGHWRRGDSDRGPGDGGALAALCRSRAASELRALAVQ